MPEQIDDVIAELTALQEKATPGILRVDSDGVEYYLMNHDDVTISSQGINDPEQYKRVGALFEIMAESANTLPTLLAHIAELKRERDGLKTHLGVIGEILKDWPKDEAAGILIRKYFEKEGLNHDQ